MAELVANCPRCGAQSITFDVTALNFLREDAHSGNEYEAFGVCRQCSKGTTFVIYGELKEPIERLTKQALIHSAVCWPSVCANRLGAAIIRGRLAPPRIEACPPGRGSGLRSGRGQIGKRLLVLRWHRPDAR